MGAVFEARHTTLQKAVAIKLLPPEDQHDAESVLRFEQEAVAAASVARKGVVDVLDFGLDPVVGAYLVMELLQGESLEARIRREKGLSAAITVAMLAPVLDALSAVHAKGIVHRDLKPANLFVARTEEGEELVKILDFGVSRVRDGRKVPTTAVGIVVGTPRFMAPEQARGVGDLDGRADVYAVGAIAYACLAGRPPYSELGFVDVIAAILSGPPAALRSLVPNVHAGLLAVIEKAMSRDRDQRYATAAEMRVALLGALAASGSPRAAVVASAPAVTVAERPSGVPAPPQPVSVPVTIGGPASTIGGAASTIGGPFADAASVYSAVFPETREPMGAPASAPPSAPPSHPALPPLGPSATQFSPPPGSYASPAAAPPHAMMHAPPPQAIAVRAHAVPHAPPRATGGRGWVVALVLLVLAFVGFAAVAVWWFTDDTIENAAGLLRSRDSARQERA